MARATYVWVLEDIRLHISFGAFTVKHELRKWIKDNPTSLENALVYRYMDGNPRGSYNVMTPEEV